MTFAAAQEQYRKACERYGIPADEPVPDPDRNVALACERTQFDFAEAGGRIFGSTGKGPMTA